jgi:hypothetical protein
MRYLAAVALLLLVACSGSDEVTLHGRVVLGMQGESAAALPFGFTSCDSNPTANKQLTFRNQDGEVIGTTTTTGTTATPSVVIGRTTICKFESAYSVTLPKADFYTVQVEGSDLTPQPPVDFNALETADFTYDVHVQRPTS